MGVAYFMNLEQINSLNAHEIRLIMDRKFICPEGLTAVCGTAILNIPVGKYEEPFF